MLGLIEEKQAALEALCQRYGVQRLDLFGSAARDDFDPDRSDLDFIVEFGPLPPGERGRAFFGLLLALEDLFERRVDLVTLASVQNPYFLQEIAASRRMIYAAVA